MNITETNVIGKLVADDYRTAEVFGKYGIDFCCKGDLSIKQACEKKGIDSSKLIEDLNAVKIRESNSAVDFQSWSLDLLADYIEKQHHRYVEQKTPVIMQYLRKVSQVHGKAHPELFDIAELFFASAGELAAHMKKEELVLFPAIRRMAQGTDTAPAQKFGSIGNPINMMKHEHTAEGERFRRIAELSNNYTPPAEACNTYRVTFSLLKEFEDDLHRHIHLENNILFPKAIQLESEMSSKSCQIG
jgi:regulator of cell morphogenesis and NO signaling